MNMLLWAAAGTGFTFLMTSLGAATVLLFRKQMSDQIQRAFLGFAAGVMIAASVWSLLIPAIEQAEEQGKIGWIPAAGGFLLGVGFLMLLDLVLPHLHPGSADPEGPPTALKRSTLMVLAVTLHNIPEGMAVGLSFAMAAQGNPDSPALTAALALALGIGIQNFPEGAAVSLPLRQEGMDIRRAFLCGSLSGIVEPIFGILTVLLAGIILPVMPWLLAFAAGAMMYVVAGGADPRGAFGGAFPPWNPWSVGGFLVMMVLDVALG